MRESKIIIADAIVLNFSRYTGCESPCILFSVPDGHAKPSPTGGVKPKVSISLLEYCIISLSFRSTGQSIQQFEEDYLKVCTGGYLTGITEPNTVNNYDQDGMFICHELEEKKIE